MNNEDGLIESLILSGALEVAGIDDQTGEFLYNITPKLKNIMPDLYQDHIETVNKNMLILWEKGYLNIDFMDDNPLVTIADKGLDLKEIKKLSQEELFALEEIKRLLMNRE
jgi:hypothetical protein